MPIGPYKDFGACVSAQRKKGHSEESAKKICGKIEQNVKKGKSSEDAEKEAILEVAVEEWTENKNG